MITLIVIKNPFNVHDRDIKQLDYSAVKTLAGYIADTCIKDEVKVAVNGGLIEPELWAETTPADGTNIIICPVVGKGDGGGKNILGMVASIALSVVAMGAGSALSGGAWFGAKAAAMSSWTFAGYCAAAAIMYIGGTLMNNATAADATIDSDYTKSTTYSWTTAKTQATQGSPIPMTFGSLKIKNNNVLSAHVTTDGDQQYLNLLVSGGEGPIDAIEDIRIEGNPIANYDGVTVETRLGTNDQKAISIPSFADNYSDQSLSYELTPDGWKTQLIDGNAVQGIEILIEFPNGLYFANDQGGLSTTGVTLAVQYRAAGSDTWTDYMANQYISAASSSAIRRSYRLDKLAAGSYEVRCKLVGKDGSTSRYANRCYWTQVSGIIPDDFAYPGLVLVAIRALATSQLSGSSPAITWLQRRSKVLVFNPAANLYEEKPATNPAWACYDILHLCKKIYDERKKDWVYDVQGCPASLIMYNDFARWAAACDARGVVCNFYLDSVGDLDAAWKPFEAAGRGKVVRRGTKYGCIYDHVAEPVQMFSVGNIKMSTFALEYLPVEDRANAVEITFNNERKDYERDTMIVYGDGYDEAEADTSSPTQITLDAITNPDTVYREGKYYLRKNKYLIRTITFEADVDAVGCQVGDVVLVQHDVPQWGFGGRIESAPDLKTLVLDREVEMDEGKTYEITVRLQDDTIVKRAVNTVVGSTNVVTVTTDMPALPAQYDVYSFGETAISTKPVTVAAITRSSDTVVKLETIEYNEAVYAEAKDVPVINYSALNFTADVVDLSLGQETYIQKDGTSVSNIYASWRSERSSCLQTSQVYTSLDAGKTWTYQGETTGSIFKIANVKTLQTYMVKVANINEMRTAGGKAKTAMIYITGKDTPPADVSYFSLVQDGGNITATILPVADLDIDHYQIRMGAIWETAVKIGDFAGTSYTFPALQNGTCSYLVKAFDTSANESLHAKKQIINITNVAAANVIYDQTFKISDFASWQNLYQHNDALCMLDARTIADFDKFADIFGQLNYIDGVVYLPLIDLGPEIIDPSCYWIDSKGVIHQQEVGKIKDYDKFAEMFGGGGDLVAPISLASTFINILIDGTNSKDINKAVEYRTSIDGYTYTDWTPDAQTIFRGRFVQIRINMSSISGHTQGVIKAVTVQIDVPDVDITLKNINLTAGVNYVPYGHIFMMVPSSISPFTVDAAGKSAAYQITERDNKGFKICLYDDSNNLTAGKITRVFIRGY